MKLYYAPNTIALAALIALEEVGADYEPVRLDFKASEQRGAEYLAINPKGRVPALVTERGVVTEVVAILAYLAQRFPAAGLMPTGPYEAAKVHETCSYFGTTMHISHAHRMRGARWSDDPAVIEGMKLKVARNMADHFGYVEAGFEGPWVMGTAYSIADPYLYCLERWAEPDGVDIGQFPKVAKHFAAMNARPAVRRALAVQS